MARNHKVQHRIRKESKETEMKKQLRELKAENQRLKRKAARARRDAEKYPSVPEAEPEDYTPMATTMPTPVAEKAGCPNGCGPLKEIKPFMKVILVCPVCHHRA